MQEFAISKEKIPITYQKKVVGILHCDELFRSASVNRHSNDHVKIQGDGSFVSKGLYVKIAVRWEICPDKHAKRVRPEYIT